MKSTTTTATTAPQQNQLRLNSEATNYANAADRIACEACNTYTHCQSYELGPGLDWATLAYKRWTLKAAGQARKAASSANATTDPTLRAHWTKRAAAAADEAQGALDELEAIAGALLTDQLEKEGWD